MARRMGGKGVMFRPGNLPPTGPIWPARGTRRAMERRILRARGVFKKAKR